MNSTEMAQPKFEKIIGEIEQVVESANMLALELTVKAFENEEMSSSLNQSLDLLKGMASRAMVATDEIERLVRGLKNA